MPIKQPGFNGKFDVFFFSVAHQFWSCLYGEPSTKQTCGLMEAYRRPPANAIMTNAGCSILPPKKEGVHSTGVIKWPILGDQTIQMYGHFEGFLLFGLVSYNDLCFR